MNRSDARDGLKFPWRATMPTLSREPLFDGYKIIYGPLKIMSTNCTKFYGCRVVFGIEIGNSKIKIRLVLSKL